MNSKQKGKRGENELVHILNAKFGEGKFKRVPFSGAITGGKNRAANENFEMKEAYTSDIAAPSNFNFVIEHKFYEEVNFWGLFSDKSKWNEWINQVGEDAKFVKKVPLLVIKYNRHKRITLVPYMYITGYAINKDSEPYYDFQKINNDLVAKIHAMARNFIWKGYSIVELEDLLNLPKDFWFEIKTEILT